MATENKIYLTILLIFAIIILLLIPFIGDENEDSEMNFWLWYIVRFFDTYLIRIPYAFIIVSFGFALLIIIPSLIIAPMHLLLGIVSENGDICNIVAAWYYLSILYYIFRKTVILPKQNINN